MQRTTLLSGVATVLLLTALLQQHAAAQTILEDKPGEASTYQNPVFDYDFPDPNLVKSDDGYFYAYATQADWRRQGAGGPYIIPVLRSKNLVNWQPAGQALDKKPSWKKEGGIWAPDAVKYQGKYYLYYAFSTWGDANPGIGLAVAPHPEGPFTDKGKVFLSKEIGVDNSIDAFLITDNDVPYLFWGSFHGIYGVELTRDGTRPKGAPFRIAGNAYEAAYIYQKDGYYYFFGSTGTCCEGAGSTYQVKTGRATSLKGPYLDQSGQPLLENGGTLLLQGNPGNTGFAGPGHNGDIITDKAGQTWLVYHAYRKDDDKRGRVMLLDKISWENGWPVIRGAVPSLERQTAPVF
ncbi:family 43 glycosylhydrolase [Chitinophaga japonensis]|uniref:Arabinan endo-1,5-alpha-L-arabinosidase n=1 Tax=Chitinophaga japonensis TaxID=104662 RepID=A0A562SUY1_CHIJA|nr:family 43 glycosylhydrolase [Chitinophaga japonensis]TWI84450.1 arabinan endo-1,5-alpha-L-arabinosidase [Chitinophaga japonensis]